MGIMRRAGMYNISCLKILITVAGLTFSKEEKPNHEPCKGEKPICFDTSFIFFSSKFHSRDRLQCSHQSSKRNHGNYCRPRHLAHYFRHIPVQNKLSLLFHYYDCKFLKERCGIAIKGSWNRENEMNKFYKINYT